MPVDNKFERCDERDPLRCQAVTKGQGGNQCPYKAVANSSYCPMHGGAAQIPINKANELKQYRLNQYQARVSEFANSSEVKNLREEIGILRMTLENLINQCNDPNKLVIYTDKIASLVNQVNKLVMSCQNIEEKNNNLLDRKIVIVIADSIVTLIGQYITDSDQLNEIGTKICESIANAASPTYSAGIVS